MLSRLRVHNNHFMALSTTEPIVTSSRRSYFALCPPKKISPRLTHDILRDILLLSELNDYEDEAEYTCEGIAELLSKPHGKTITQRAASCCIVLHREIFAGEEQCRANPPPLSPLSVASY
jgi:hypothetical protein